MSQDTCLSDVEPGEALHPTLCGFDSNWLSRQGHKDTPLCCVLEVYLWEFTGDSLGELEPNHTPSHK